MNPPDLQARADALEHKARGHKREERRHRMAARAARKELAALKAECARLGIGIQFSATGEGNDPWPKTSSSTSTR